MNIGTGVAQGVAIVILHPGRYGIEVGRNAEAVALATVGVVLLFVVDAAIEGEVLVNAPCQVIEDARLLLVPLPTLTGRITWAIVREGNGAIIVVAVVIQLAAKAHVIIELPIRVQAEVLHVAVITVIGVLGR